MEDDIFLKKMKGVKPFKRDNKKNVLKKKSKTSTDTRKKSELINTPKEAKETNKNKKSYFNLSFSSINKDLKKGKIKIDRRIDLHGYSLLDAYEKFKNEVVQTYNLKKRCILVITGKGLYAKKNNEEAPNKLYYGKIKNSITTWVQDKNLQQYILTYQDAGIEHGGDGAIFVYLRKRKD